MFSEEITILMDGSEADVGKIKLDSSFESCQYSVETTGALGSVTPEVLPVGLTTWQNVLDANGSTVSFDLTTNHRTDHAYGSLSSIRFVSSAAVDQPLTITVVQSR